MGRLSGSGNRLLPRPYRARSFQPAFGTKVDLQLARKLPDNDCWPPDAPEQGFSYSRPCCSSVNLSTAITIVSKFRARCRNSSAMTLPLSIPSVGRTSSQTRGRLLIQLDGLAIMLRHLWNSFQIAFET